MSPHLPPKAQPARGFTMVELVVVVSILGILMAAGIPNLMAWMSGTRANAVPEFYLDGLRRAREGAIKYNTASRLVLIPNANGQFDWQIDWCSPVANTACNDTSGNWSSTSSPTSSAAGQPRGPSIFRSAGELPNATSIESETNNSETEIYFNSIGWLNTDVANIRWMRFTSSDPDILPAQISIPLSGVAERCNPAVSASDSRACPP